MKKAKAKVGGKGKEKKEEEKEEKKMMHVKRCQVDKSDGEEDMAPSGWRPPKGSTVRNIDFIS